ncbi:MAG: hypothetical protein QM640_03195 [Niabella sp.]
MLQLRVYQKRKWTAQKCRFACVVLFPALLTLFSSCEDILEKDLSNEQVVLVAPSDSVVTSDTLQRFSWDAVASAVQYQLQVVTPSFEQIELLYIDSLTTGNQLQISLPEGKQYQWRVRALNNSYTSPYSNVWTLTIQP